MSGHESTQTMQRRQTCAVSRSTCAALACDLALDRGLHLFKGADLDLAHALARHAELGSKIFQRHRLFRETTRLEDAPLARVEHTHRAGQRLVAMIVLFALGHAGFLVR